MFFRPVIEVEKVRIESNLVLDNTKAFIERKLHTIKHGLKCIPIDVIIPFNNRMIGNICLGSRLT